MRPTRAALELADLPGHPARHAARRHKGAVEAVLREELERHALAPSDLLARQIMLLLEGCMLLVIVHGDAAYVDAAAHAARRLVERAGVGGPAH